MAISIIPKEKQEKGSFNLGAIKENRPVVLSQSGKGIPPYSNIFYWAHAWSDAGSLLGEHPHQAFEIMSFILKGEVEHYDSKSKEWLKLHEGSAQIIRAGNGISHAEDFKPGTEIFQIWLDPDLNKSINKSPTYNDYPSGAFPVINKNGKIIKTYKGADAPIEMDTPDISIKEIILSVGDHSFNINNGKILSAYLIEGSIQINKNEMETDSFAVIKEEESIEIYSEAESRLFIIESPLKPLYKTYLDLYPVQA